MKKLPITVDKFNSDYSKRTKYVVSYTIDGDKVTILIKDYTDVGLDAIRAATETKGYTFDGCEIKYQDLSVEMENGHAF